MEIEISYTPELYQSLYESLTDAVLVADTQGKCLYVNPSFTKVFNAGTTEVLGKGVDWCLSRIRLQGAYNLFQKVASTHAKQSDAYVRSTTHIKYAVTVVPVDLCLVMLFTPCGTVSALLNGETAAFNGRIGYFERYFGSEEIFWSDELYLMHGMLPQSEVMTQENVITFIHPDERELYLESVHKSLNSKQPFSITHHVITRTGELRLMRARGEYLKDKQGNINRIYGTVQDITEYEVRQNLKESKELLDGVVNAPNIGLAVYQAIRNDEGKIIDFVHLLASKRTEEMLLHRRPLVGKTMKEVFKKHYEQEFKSFCQVVETGKPNSHEIHYKTAKRNIWFQISNSKYKDGVIHVWEDITERKNAEMEIMRTKNILGAIFNTSKIGLSVMQSVRNKEGKIVDFIYSWNNDEVTKMAGGIDITGMHMLDAFPVAKDLGIFGEYVNAVEKNGFADIERSFKSKGIDGWFRWTAVKLDDGLFVTVEDITARKKVEEEKLRDLAILQQSEQLAQLGSWDYDVKTGTYHWSEGMYRLFDIPKETEVEPDIYLTYATESCQPVARRIVDYIKSGYSPFEETLDIKVDSQVKTITVRGQIIHTPEDNSVQVVGVDWNITNTKRAEARIKDNADLIRGIADAAPDMLYVIDIRSMRMVYANGNITRMFNKTVEQIRDLGPMFFDAIIHPDDREKFDSNIKQLREAASHDVRELVYRVFDSRGNVHWVKTRRTVYKRNQKGLATHVIGVSQDITPQVVLRDQNKQLERERKDLEERQQKEILTAILSAQEEERKRIAESLHNGLGQLLYGVKMNLEQVNVTKPYTDIEELHHARQLTAQLLTEAIKECRRISHELTPGILEDFGLKYAIQDICQQFARTMNMHCHFTGMYFKLEQYIEIAIYRMVQELVLNVVKHAKATKLDVTLNYKRKSITIIVEDNGVGFDSRQEHKHGIGLKTIRNKVKLLQGKLVITSAPQNGTTFNITIPLKN